MAATDEAIEFAHHLDGLTSYLRAILDLEDDNKVLTFVWDHEMIHEILNPFDSRSVYSGLLWYGLQCLRESAALNAGDQWRIIIPEGTRQELQEYLHRLLGRYASLLTANINPQSKELAVRSTANALRSFNRTDYREVLQAISQLKDVERTVAKLLVFLQRYARPLPFSPDDLPAESKSYYTARLETKRKLADDIKRNDADALNLACIDKLAADNQGTSPALITATIAVQKAAKHLTNDPLFFALAASHIKRYPDRGARRRAINRALVRLQDLVNHSDDLRQQPGKAFTRRSDVREFLTALVGLRKEPYLMDIAILMTEAQQAVQTSAVQTARVAREFATLRMLSGASPEYVIERVNAALAGQLMPQNESDLKWITPNSINEEPQALVTGPYGAVIEAAQIPEGLAIAWRTYEALDGFFDNVQKLATAGGDRITSLSLRYSGRLETKTIAVSTTGDYRFHSGMIISEEKSTLIRADLGNVRAWYHPGEIVFGDDLLGDRSSSTKQKETRMAVHIYSHSFCSLSAQLVARTSTRYIDGQRLASCLEGCFPTQ